jgi:hypothetical protein
MRNIGHREEEDWSRVQVERQTTDEKKEDNRQNETHDKGKKTGL